MGNRAPRSNIASLRRSRFSVGFAAPRALPSRTGAGRTAVPVPEAEWMGRTPAATSPSRRTWWRPLGCGERGASRPTSAHGCASEMSRPSAHASRRGPGVGFGTRRWRPRWGGGQLGVRRDQRVRQPGVDRWALKVPGQSASPVARASPAGRCVPGLGTQDAAKFRAGVRSKC